MKATLAALAVLVLLSPSARSAEAAKTNEKWSRAKSVHRIGGSVVHHAAAVHPASSFSGGGASISPSYPSSSRPSYGPIVPGSGQSSGVRPLRPMARSRTMGAGVFVAGGSVQGRGYVVQQAGPASASPGAGAGFPILTGKGRALDGPGVARGPADAAPGGGADSPGNDPFKKIMTGLANMFGDMAKAMNALWGNAG